MTKKNETARGFAAVAVQWFDAIVRRHAPTKDPFAELSEENQAEWLAMVEEMREVERMGPPADEARACTCGYPKQPCLRVVLRNGPPYPARPCESVRRSVDAV